MDIFNNFALIFDDVHFDTSAWKWFCPCMYVWKGHTKFKSSSRSRIFLYDMHKAWFSACFFIRACAKSSFAHGMSKIILRFKANK